MKTEAAENENVGEAEKNENIEHVMEQNDAMPPCHCSAANGVVLMPTSVTNTSVYRFCELLADRTDDEDFTSPVLILVRELQVNLSCLIES